MRNILYIFLIILVSTSFVAAQTQAPDTKNVIKIEADAASGFAYPYYLFVPDALREAAAKNETHNLLVAPNNTGKVNDNLSVHEANVKQKMMQMGMAFGKMNAPVLMPVFPRPGTDW